MSAADGLGTFLLFGKPRRASSASGTSGRVSARCSSRSVATSCAYDPWLTDAYLRHEGVEPAALRRLLETSRVIFVLATPTSENEALLSRELLELVRPDAVLVLVSRAHVVDFDALTELVLAGRFRAAIDVFPTEPLDRGASDPERAGRRAVAAPGRASSRRRCGSSAGSSSTTSRR